MQPSDPFYERRAQMFPKLDDAQRARVCKVGKRRTIREGEILIEVGDAITPFFVVLAGSIDIVRVHDHVESLIARHAPGEFSGEMNMLSGRRSLFRARASADGELLELDHEALRRLVQTDSELSELLMRAYILRRVALIHHQQGNVLLLGSRHSAATLRIREFLTRNSQPFSYLDVDHDPDVQPLLDRFHVLPSEIPLVICRGELLQRNPSNRELAACLGLNPELDAAEIHDVVVVGAGPSGLAAAVYAASEGLKVLVIETNAPGGQAGSSSKIENYLGFPTGISGQALAGRAFAQAQKFGAQILIASGAIELDCARTPYALQLADGARVLARTIVLACGAQYRRLDCADAVRFDGNGLYYGATRMEAQLCADNEVIVVGGGNSAGQAAVFLASNTRHVHMLVRASGLADTMSRYLIRRIEEHPAITLRTHTEIVGLEGEPVLARVHFQNRLTGHTETHAIEHVFLMMGADPNTGWLTGCVALDDKGFVKTGTDLTASDLSAWTVSRTPHMLETSVPGVFAVGDVRCGSVKRVASAVGEGSICVQLVHKVLAAQ